MSGRQRSSALRAAHHAPYRSRNHTAAERHTRQNSVQVQLKPALPRPAHSARKRSRSGRSLGELERVDKRLARVVEYLLSRHDRRRNWRRAASPAPVRRNWDKAGCCWLKPSWLKLWVVIQPRSKWHVLSPLLDGLDLPTPAGRLAQSACEYSGLKTRSDLLASERYHSRFARGVLVALQKKSAAEWRKSGWLRADGLWQAGCREAAQCGFSDSQFAKDRTRA